MSPAEVQHREVIALLRRYGLQLVMAVRPHDLEDVTALLQRFADEDVDLALWPMLDDAQGRWLSDTNADAFGDFVDRILDRCDAAQARPVEVVLDLEPPIRSVRELSHLHLLRAWSSRRFRTTNGSDPGPRRRGKPEEVIRRITDRGIAVWGAVVPMVLADPTDARGWQRLLGTPVDGQPWMRIHSMLYSSVAVGYAGRWIRRTDVEHLLFESARAAVRRWGPRAAASVGAVGVGALGDEAVYRDPSELARDVGLVRAAGIEDLALFELGGVLARRPAEAWLDAFCQTEPATQIPKRTRRALVTTGLMVAIGRLAALRR